MCYGASNSDAQLCHNTLPKQLKQRREFEQMHAALDHECLTSITLDADAQQIDLRRVVATRAWHAVYLSYPTRHLKGGARPCDPCALSVGGVKYTRQHMKHDSLFGFCLQQEHAQTVPDLYSQTCASSANADAVDGEPSIRPCIFLKLCLFTTATSHRLQMCWDGSHWPEHARIAKLASQWPHLPASCSLALTT